MCFHINAAFKSNIVQVIRCLWLSVAQLKLTHLMHKTIKYKSVLLRMQIILMYITEHNVRQKTTFYTCIADMEIIRA